METTSNLTTISTPEQAVEELVGDQFVTWLIDYTRHQVGAWEELTALPQTEVTVPKLRRFLLQVFAAERAMWQNSDDSPGFLKFAIANLSECNDPAAEFGLDVLQTNLTIDTWSASWPKLFTALGLNPGDFAKIEPKEATRNYIAELSEVYSTAEWQEAVAAFAAQWMIMPYKFGVIYTLAQRAEGVEVKDLEVLKVLSTQETKSRQLSFELLEKLSFSQATKDMVWQGVSRTLEIEKEFFRSASKYLQTTD
jgi:hypothetical protein